jgi:zinc protease
LARAGAEESPDAEVEKAKQQIIAQVAYNRDGTSDIASQMSEAEAVADWRFYKDYAANIARVTVSDVRRVALRYLTEDNRTVGYFIPKASADGQGETDEAGANGSKGASFRLAQGERTKIFAPLVFLLCAFA